MRFGVIDLLWLLILLILIFGGPRDILLGDPGLGWHLRTGQWILENRQVPAHDLFLFLSNPDKPWVDSQWLAQLVFSLIQRLGDNSSLLVFGWILCVAPHILILTPLTIKRCDSFALGSSAVIFAAVVASIQWLLRPVLFSFLFFALVYCLAFRFYQYTRGEDEHRPKSFYVIPVLFLFWVNLHPAFIMGLAVLVVLSLLILLKSGFSERFYLALSVSVLSVLATLVNPYGLAVYHHIFSLVGNEYFMRLNREWLPPDIFSAPFLAFTVSLFFVICGLRASIKKSGVFDVVLLLGLGVLSLLQRRYIPYFAIVSCFTLAEGLRVSLGKVSLLSSFGRSLEKMYGRETYPKWAIIFCFVFGGIVLISGQIPFSAKDHTYLSNLRPYALSKALRDLPNSGSGRVLNHPDFGGATILFAWPSKSLFIDDRNIVNGEMRYREFFEINQATGNSFDKIKSYDFEWILLPESSPIVSSLLSSNNWRRIAVDNGVVLLQKRYSSNGSNSSSGSIS